MFPKRLIKGMDFAGGNNIFSTKKLIVFDGCYWACPYELVFYDFSNPMNVPYNELSRVDVDSVLNWDSWKDSCRVIYLDKENNETEFVF